MLLSTLSSGFMRRTKIIIRHLMICVCNLHRTVCRLSRLCRAYMWHIRLCRTDAPRQRLWLAYSSVKAAKSILRYLTTIIFQCINSEDSTNGSDWNLRYPFGQASSYLCWDVYMNIYVYIYIYTYSFINIYIHIYMYVCIYSLMHLYMYIYIFL